MSTYLLTGIFNVTQMLMHTTAHGGCNDTVRESALKADSARKIPCRTVRVLEPAPGFSVGRSTNRAIPAPLIRNLKSVSDARVLTRVCSFSGFILSQIEMRLDQKKHGSDC